METFSSANNHAITFESTTGKTVKEFPVLPGGSRNYPPSGSAALFPMKLTTDNAPAVPEIVQQIVYINLKKSIYTS